MQPLVSILIPAFNAAPYIAATIDSALAQTWSRKEIIVVDDGSTDNTLAICRQFSTAALTIVSQPHQGVAAASNRTLSVSQGDYIQWLDADDLIAPDKIALQLAAIDGVLGRRTLVSSAWAYFRHRPYAVEFTPTILWADLSPAEFLVRKLEHNVFMSNATWLVSRELTDAAGPWDTGLAVDNDGEYLCRVLLASDGVRFVPGARAFYRRRAGSLSYIGRSDRKIASQFRSTQLHIGYLRSLEESPRVRAACLAYLQRSMIHIYPERPDLVAKAHELAASLDGELAVPRLSWKYVWIQKLFGWSAAKRAQLGYNRCKTALVDLADKSLSRLETRRSLVKYP